MLTPGPLDYSDATLDSRFPDLVEDYDLLCCFDLCHRRGQVPADVVLVAVVLVAAVVVAAVVVAVVVSVTLAAAWTLVLGQGQEQ